jgi:argininosuccinate lyase
LLIPQITFEQDNISLELEIGYSQATEIADSLARKGVPFRDAHGLVGKLVFDCQKKGIYLSQTKPLEQFNAVEWKEITSLKRKRLEVSPAIHLSIEKQIDSLSSNIQRKYSSLIQF